MSAITQNNWFSAEDFSKNTEALSKSSFERDNESFRVAQRLQWEEDCRAKVREIIHQRIPFGKLEASVGQEYTEGPDTHLRANDAFYEIVDCGSVLRGSTATQQNSCFYMAYLSSKEQKQMSTPRDLLDGEDGVELMAWKNELIRFVLAVKGDDEYMENGKAVLYFEDSADTPIYYAAVLIEGRPIAIFDADKKEVHRITTRDLHQKRVPYISIYLKDGHFQALIKKKSQ